MIDKNQIGRIESIDILKTIGLFGIILAHVSAVPEWLFFLRQFDVILMIFISSRLFFRKNRHIDTPKKYLLYVVGRIKRLYLPTVLFLVAFFGVTCWFKEWGLKTIIDSFLLRGGVGFVWIIRIFLLEALIAPIVAYVSKQVNTRRKKVTYIVVLCGLLIGHELLCHFGIYKANVILSDVVAYIIPVFIICQIAYAIFVGNSSKRRIWVAFVLSAVSWLSIVLMGMILDGRLLSLQDFKYPFRFYYISYGLMVSALLSLVFDEKRGNALYGKYFEFVGKHSLWIYLWHIAVFYALDFIGIAMPFWCEFIVLVAAASALTFLQNKIVKSIESVIGENFILAALKS